MKSLNIAHLRALPLALAAAFVGMAPTAHAVVVVTPASLVVPFTLDGVYLNVVTGATGTSGGTTPGWDINPYFTGSTTATPALAFFATTTGDPNRGILVTPVAAGSTVSSALTFSTGAQGVAASVTNTPGIYNFAFRFTNEATAALNYGYVTLEVAPPLGNNAVRILGWAYENTGASLTVTPVPEPSSALLLGGGLLAAFAMRKRLMAGVQG